MEKTVEDAAEFIRIAFTWVPVEHRPVPTASLSLLLDAIKQERARAVEAETRLIRAKRLFEAGAI